MARKSKLTTTPKDYALGRVCYNLMVASEAACRLKDKGTIATNAVAKIVGLIMARNLHDFLFEARTKNSHSDDIFANEFQLQHVPDNQAKLSSDDKKRINKIAGHIVQEDPGHFDRNADVLKVLVPLIDEGAKFVNKCLNEGKAVLPTSRASKYAQETNRRLPNLGIRPPTANPGSGPKRRPR